jgi:hypothetical protein
LEPSPTKQQTNDGFFAEFSLATLKAAGSHPRLRDRIEKLRLGTHRGQWVEFPTFFCCERNNKIAIAMERIDREYRVPVHWADVETHGSDRGALVVADVIQSLPALRSIEIGELCKPGDVYQIGWLGSKWPSCAGECHGTRQVDYEGRDPLEYVHNDTPEERWEGSDASEWGHFDARDMMRLKTTHAVERQRHTRHWRLSKCFQEILHALTLVCPAPGARALESLSVGSYDGKKNRVYGAYLNGMNSLEENDPLFTALQPVLASVRQVHLAVEIGAKRGSLSSCVPHSNPETWLIEFLKLVPRLQTLHLYLNGKSQWPWKPRYTQKKPIPRGRGVVLPRKSVAVPVVSQTVRRHDQSRQVSALCDLLEALC